MRSNLKYLVPNGITVLAIFVAFISMHYAITGDYNSAAWFIFFSFILDTMDGGAARALKATSEFGRELDSLADVINLGVAPGILLYRVYFDAWGNWSLLLGFVCLVAVTTRLARFNMIGKERYYFSGMTSPHFAGGIVSYLLFSDAVWGEYRFPGLVTIVVFVMWALMMSNIRYESTYFIKPGEAFKSWQAIAFMCAAVLAIISPKHVLFFLGLGLIWMAPLRALLSRRTMTEGSPLSGVPETH